ncbi:MAG TPA: PrsW family glutamic-type intramembrane protease [Candidatus Limnocylindrales bacterium]|nr:PrsW family glutamic-type intramembrane protease [Candidatus Limnocylindrales bacterium]
MLLVAGCLVFYATGSVNVMALTSFLAMSGICWAFYRFAARRLALDDVVGALPLVTVMAATAGAVILIASNVNTAIIDIAGIRTGLATVGFIEESTKLLVPLTLLAFGRYADPRAGIAIALASGFGFAIIEATQYAYSEATASGPNQCGGEVSRPTVESVIRAQVYRIFLVEPMHWLWTGFAAAVAWRLWHLYSWPRAMCGRKGTPGAAGAILLVMVVHSLNDSSAALGCDNASVAFLAQVFRWALVIAMYQLFKVAARKSTPPQLIGVVSKGWTPHRLRTYTRQRAFANED